MSLVIKSILKNLVIVQAIKSEIWTIKPLKRALPVPVVQNN